MTAVLFFLQLKVATVRLLEQNFIFSLEKENFIYFIYLYIYLIAIGSRIFWEWSQTRL